MQGDKDEAERLKAEAMRCDKRAEQHAEDNPMYAEHMRRRAAHCRRLARDEEAFQADD